MSAPSMPSPTSSPDLILETHQLVKSFDGLVAVDHVSLGVLRGQIHALIGPNGAGKTTLFNLLTRFVQPTAGRILFKGIDITRANPAQVARHGLVRSIQISSIFPHMSVLENIRIGLQRKLGRTYFFWLSDKTLEQLDARAIELLHEVGLERLADQPAGSLPYGRRRALELATTLALEPELMLLDEPTQGMGHEDVEQVTELIRRIARGRTVLLVEHNMKVVASIADTITVLQRGAILAEGPYAQVSVDPRVITAYMGKALRLPGMPA